jgi:cell wall integrity and stress response component
MQNFTRSPLALLIVLLGFLSLISEVSALNALYCSSQNTGSDYAKQTNQFNSNGACFTNCKSQYAFAIVQGTACWCSNYIPAEVSSNDDCDSACPGYPQELCGSTSSDLFGYIQLTLPASGTAGASSSAAASTAGTSSDSNSHVTSISTPQPTTFETSITSDTTTSSSAQQTTSSWIPTPVTSLITVTGHVQTVTITPTAPPPEAQVLASHSWSTGKIAGIAVGVATIIAILAVLCLFLAWRRRQNNSLPPAVYKSDDESPQRYPSRTSQMSLMGTRSPLAVKPLPQIVTSGLDGIPYGNGRSPEMSSPSSKRASYPRLHDQRLDPHALFVSQDNGSRASIRSLQDEHDYSRRVLRLANPDE